FDGHGGGGMTWSSWVTEPDRRSRKWLKCDRMPPSADAHSWHVDILLLMTAIRPHAAEALAAAYAHAGALRVLKGPRTQAMCSTGHPELPPGSLVRPHT